MTGDMLLRPGLPTEIQAALSTLITRLILEHADKSCWALLYVRQSLAHQVLHNCGSSALQYAIAISLTGETSDRVRKIPGDRYCQGSPGSAIYGAGH